jgi:hypothetical protein
VLGFVASAFFVFSLGGTIISDLFARGVAHGVGGLLGTGLTLALVCTAISGYIISWSAERAGALLMVLAGSAQGMLVLTLGGAAFLRPALFYSLPFVIPGLLLAVSWVLRRERKVLGQDLYIHRKD